MSIASAQAPHCTIVSIIDRAESFLSNDPPPPDIYTLSLHDALPISYLLWKSDGNAIGRPTSLWSRRLSPNGRGWQRSEEHTSELQSLTNLVCRLLLEKKNAQRKEPRHHRRNHNRTPPEYHHHGPHSN